jgi:hypothetical protein
MKLEASLIPITLAFLCIAFLPETKAVSPPPDGGYPGGNTAEGQSALLSLTSGGFNTAIGFLSVRSDATGSFNTAVGAGTLLANTADRNTATGAGALLSDTTGFSNTANGAFALFSNTAGSNNTAIGHDALINNTFSNANTAIGGEALVNNTSGSQNTATGQQALSNNTTGSDNIALGFHAGGNVTTATNVICIGANLAGNNVDDSCFIGNIFGATSSGGTAVFVNSNGRLGTLTSSRRFKEEITPIGKASEALLALRPVTFRYKKEIDPAGTWQFGLVAEDVEKVNPDLVVRDKEGKPYSVRYDQVNAMVLNEFLKEHKTVQELKSALRKQESIIAQLQCDGTNREATIGNLEKAIEVLVARLNEQDSKIQKVSDQLEMTRTVRQTVAINR